jgi:uncharacterized membrane protein (DUF4010 family)
MDLSDLISRFGAALGMGLLIGIERGWRTREADPGARTAGVRTFAITGLLGGVVGALAQALGTADGAGGLLLGLAFAAYAAVFAVFCRDENRKTNTFSATTAVAGMVTFALGAYALVGDLRIAAAAAVTTAGLLALREDLHGFVERITWPELRSALILLAMTCIVLPIVPDEPIGPFGGINPRQIWTIAIVLAGVSFLGYVAVKYLGTSHGVLLAAAAGGLVSSTAVTATNARRAAAGEGSPRLLAAGVSLANAISFARVVAVVAALNPGLLVMIAPPLIAAALVAGGLALAAVYWRRDEEAGPHGFELRNPFGFWSVVGFAVLLGAIILIGGALGERVGAVGAIIGAAAMGVADVDAVTVSMARLAPQPLGIGHAGLAILVAVASNMACKVAIGAGIGRGRFAVEIAVMSAASLVAAALAAWATFAAAA